MHAAEANQHLFFVSVRRLDPSTMMMQHGQEGPPSRWSPFSRYHHRDDDPPPPPPPNGSAALALILRLCTTMLALASATVMAASSECTPRSTDAVVTFTYTRFRAFVLLVGCSITAAILEAVAVYLHLSISVAAAAAAPADDDKTVTGLEEEEEEEAGVSAAEILLVLVDLLVPALLYSAMAATYTASEIYGDQIGSCGRFAGQVMQAKILSLAACAAVTLAGAAKGVPLPFNVPPVLG